MARGLTRRQTLAALLAGGAVASVAGNAFLTNEEALVREVLDRSIGDYDMGSAQFALFLDDFHATYGDASRRKLAAFRVMSAAGDAGARLAPMAIVDPYVDFEREVVTHFLTRTDYLHLQPGQPASFLDAAGCTSPFARFDFA